MGWGTRLGVYLKAISSSGSLLLLLLLHFHGGEIITGASADSTRSALVPPSTQTSSNNNDAGSAPATEGKCDKVVLVETPELLSYLGNVTFTVPTPFRGRWTTVIKFTSPYTFIGGWGVEVQSFGIKSYAIFQRNEAVNLKAGDLVIFQFRVLYGYRSKVPKVLSIKWENKSICGPPILGGPSLPDSIILRKTFDNLHSALTAEGDDDFVSSPDDSLDEPSSTGDQDDNQDDIDVDNAEDIISDNRPSDDREGPDADDNIRETIQQHIASNRIRLVNNWKPAENKD